MMVMSYKKGAIVHKNGVITHKKWYNRCKIEGEIIEKW